MVRQRRSRDKTRSGIKPFSLILILIFLLTISSVTVFAEEAAPEATATEPAPTVEPTEAPTEMPTDAPTVEPTVEPTDAPTEEPTDPPTEEPTIEPTEEPTAEITEEATDEATPSETPEAVIVVGTPAGTPEVVIETPSPFPTERPSINGLAAPSAASASCQMDINDAGDSDPYTFNFAAINTIGIVSYQWDFGDSASSSNQSDSHTYAAPGSYSVSLTCVPTVGANLVLSGTITISNPTVAGFALSPGVTGFAPFTITLVNTSSGSGLTYLWQVTGPETYSSTSTNASFTLSTPGSYTVTLTASDSGGQSSTASAGVVVKVPAPLADFTVSPSMGAPPLVVTVQGVMDASSGPIDTWSWDFGDGSPTVTGQGPHTHTYTAEGTFSITMNYSGGGGLGMVMRQVAVFNAGDVVTADFSYSLNGNSGGGMEVCFTNLSTGPVVTNTWDFGDGSPLVVNNSAVVCHIYMSESSFDVYLTAVAADPLVTSTARRSVSVIFAPTAHFTASLTTLEAGDTVNFDSTTSTGIIDSWAWDFNNDGTIDSTQQNPAGIAFNTIGGNTVRLTVTGPGGSSTAEMLLIVVRAEITCTFSGNFTPAPGNTITYDGVVTNLRGRAATYSWTISGPQNYSFSSEDASVTWNTVGSYLAVFSVTTADGANCSETKSIQVQWPTLTCSISGNFTPSPNGSSYAYTATVNNLAGRTATYKWFIDNVQQPETTSSISRSWTLPTIQDLRVEITTTDGSGDCLDSRTLNVQWPALSCSISGNASPLPQLPDDPTRSHTYTANLTGLDGRSVTYQWIVDGVVQASTGPTLTLSWAWNQTGTYNVQLNVVADNKDATTTPCTASRNLNVNVPALICNAPFGDTAPVLNETVTYTRNVSNQFGRNITTDSWEFEQYDAVNGWVPIATGTGNSFTYLFNVPNTQYRIRYSIAVEMPTDGCTSAWQIIDAAGSGVDFICEFGPNGNLSPGSASTNYVYNVSVDNTNALALTFNWVLVDSTGGERILATNTSTIDGVVNSPAISGASMGPADNYTLRVDVSANPLVSTYKCSLAKAIVVGTLTVDYSFTVNNNAVEVGQQICLTNISSTSHGDINALTYTWDFGTATNSLGSQTSSAQQPGCLSYPNPGTYAITLTGTNASGLRSASRSYVFNVYGSQSIAISMSNQVFAPATMSFSAISVNVNAPYSWTFRNVVSGATIGTRTGKNVTFFFNTAGTYEAIVSASGPLGVTTATAQFTLLAVDDIRAAFTPSTYNGPAVLNVCFTDRSVGNNIISWAWDFNNDGVTDSTQQNPCTSFSVGSTAYPIRLTIQNASGKTATATNVIRTFNALESQSTFTIIPRGSGLYCFQSVLGGGTTVTSWDFGDGSTVSTGSLDYVCHQFNSAGSYAVTMNITKPPETGSVTRPVDVDPNPNPPVPSLVVNASCSLAGGAVFTVTNNGGDMTTPDSLKITDANGVVVVVDDTLKLANGQSKTYTVTGSYGTLTLTTVDTAVSASTYCNHPPRLSGSAVCQMDGSVQFIITNSSLDTAANQSYSVTDGNNVTVQTGTITAGANGGTQTITVAYSPSLTFSTSGSPSSTTTVTLTSTCAEPPVLSVSVVCELNGDATFTVVNNSKDTAANQSYSVTDVNNSVVQTGTITAAANGGTQVITVTDAYENKPVTLTSTGGAQGATTVLSLTQSCDEPPKLSGSAYCMNGDVVFSINNSSGDSDSNQTYQIVNDGGLVMQSGTLIVPAGGKISISLPGVTGIFTLTSDSPAQGPATYLKIEANCVEPSAQVALNLSMSSTPLPAEADAGTPLNIVGGACSRGCIDLQVFHTNRNGHWDIYRLIDEGDNQPDADINLTDTKGKFDNMAPTRSPNAEWIVFASNRDGNWELYLAPTNGNTQQTRRLTFNDIAIDTDPVWGPNNFVVFETNRNGNWDLYLLDMNTGKFYELTNNPASDVNPAWSNDGSKLLFQSNRSGQWQIYEMDMATFQMRLLSDGKGNDMDPSYSEDDSRIVFRSDRSGAESVVYVMSADGANPVAISDPAGYATNQSWSPDDSLIAYQSDIDGDLDVYVYEVVSGKTRKLTDNAIPDYAPTWRCATNQIIFTSDIDGEPDIYETKPTPIVEPGIQVDLDANRMTNDNHDDIYPEGSPVEENASREGRLPDLSSILSGETSFLKPDTSIIPPDLSLDTGNAWEDIGNTCTASGLRDDLASVIPSGQG